MASDAHYFIGIGLTPEARRRAAAIQAEVRPYFSYKTWTMKEDFHITLQFLGAVNMKRLASIDRQLRHTDLGQPFFIELGALGYFGSREQPRVLWVVVVNHSRLAYLQKSIADVLHTQGFEPEKRAYRPHITLGKKWYGPDMSPSILQRIQAQYEHDVYMPVEQIGLYHIDPRANPKYTCVKTYELKRGSYQWRSSLN